MKHLSRSLLWLALTGVTSATMAANDDGKLAPIGQTMDERVTKLERLMDTQSLVELLNQLEALQNEVQQLRGQVEEQNHEIEALKKRQLELFRDTDRRITELERGAPRAPVSTSEGSEGGQQPALVQPQGAVPPGVNTGAVQPDMARQAKEREAYEEAFNLLKGLRYEQAISSFQGFLKSYPDGRYAHIAQYWLGEAYYAQRHFQQAIVEYRKLLSNYSNSPKLAEAMLKIGYCHKALQQTGQARIVLQDLMNRYPGTTEAGQAEMLLKKLY